MTTGRADGAQEAQRIEWRGNNESRFLDLFVDGQERGGIRRRCLGQGARFTINGMVDYADGGRVLTDEEAQAEVLRRLGYMSPQGEPVDALEMRLMKRLDELEARLLRITQPALDESRPSVIDRRHDDAVAAGIPKGMTLCGCGSLGDPQLDCERCGGTGFLSAVLLQLLSEALTLCEHGDYRNGNTHPDNPGGTDEGAVLADREISRIADAAGLKRGRDGRYHATLLVPPGMTPCSCGTLADPVTPQPDCPRCDGTGLLPGALTV